MKQAGRIGLIFSLSALLVTPAFGEGEVPPWKGNLEFSYIETSGNTESKTLSGAGKVERNLKRAKITGEARGIYGKNDGVTSNKSWFGSLKYDQNISDRTSAYLLETAERDTLKGVEFRFKHQAGVGHYFIRALKDTLQLQAGAGYTQENRIDPFNDKGYPNGRAFGEFIHLFSETNRFEQTVEYLPNLSDPADYLITEESALISNLWGNLSFKTSFAVTFDNEPSEGFKKSDRVFKTALLYAF